jgi:hypothetical protein
MSEVTKTYQQSNDRSPGRVRTHLTPPPDMAKVWILDAGDDAAVRSTDAADGDFVARLQGDEVDLGQLDRLSSAARQIRWLGSVEVATLPAGALDVAQEAPADAPLAPAARSDALLRAVRGLQTAERYRGA